MAQANHLFSVWFLIDVNYYTTKRVYIIFFLFVISVWSLRVYTIKMINNQMVIDCAWISLYMSDEKCKLFIFSFAQFVCVWFHWIKFRVFTQNWLYYHHSIYFYLYFLSLKKIDMTGLILNWCDIELLLFNKNERRKKNQIKPPKSFGGCFSSITRPFFILYYKQIFYFYMPIYNNSNKKAISCCHCLLQMR